jgi:hypothetical protein
MRQGGKLMEPKYKRGQWVVVFPGPYQTHAPFVAQIADIDEAGANSRYQLIVPSEPYPMTEAPQENLRLAALDATEGAG